MLSDSEHNMVKESTEKNWDIYYSLPFFDWVFKRMSKTHYDFFYKPLIKNLNFKTTLEFGGGTGHLTMKIKDTKNTTPTILDHNNKAMNKHHRAYNKTPAKYLIGDVFNIKFNNNEQYDLVFSDGLIEHFKEPKQTELINKHFKLSKKYVLIAAPKPSLYSDIFAKIVCYEKGMHSTEIVNAAKKNGFKVIARTENQRYFSVLAEKI